MKTKVITILAVVILFFIPTQVYAVPIDKVFTSSGQILTGEEWNNVSIYNDATIVDMLGGDVDGIATYDASTVNVTGGQVNTLATLEFSTANVSGGFVYGLRAWNNSIINFSDYVNAVNLSANDLGTVNMSGGSTDYLGAYDSGTVNIYRGVISDCLLARNSSVVNIYGYDLDKTSFGGLYDYGQVSGFWQDGTSFTINLTGSETYSHINLIPEPSALLLLALGSLLLKRKK